jgi:hypothetical protein
MVCNVAHPNPDRNSISDTANQLLRGQKVKAGKTLHLPKPTVDPKELLEVEQEYLRRYFRSKQEMQHATAATAPSPVANGEKEITQSLPLYQPINRRERLR